MSELDHMIRPWWRGKDAGIGDHIYRDCEALEEEGEPREGVGWLDPCGTDICPECSERYDPDAYEERMLNEHE